MDNDYSFIFITYSLPSEPSRIRVYIWRLLKRMGALNMQQSLWLLPKNEEMLSAVDKVKESIENSGGSAYIVIGQFLNGEKEIIKRFNEERDAEYKEFLDYCQKFHEEMKHETEIQNFTFAELEENEEELQKLLSWYENIKKRDYYESQSGKTAKEELDLCREEFEKFSNTVFEKNNIG